MKCNVALSMVAAGTLAVGLLPAGPARAAESISGDFGVTTGQISPQLFGAVHYPSLTPKEVDPDIGDHTAAWGLITDTMGVTYMRADARLQEILPLTVKKPGTNWSGEREPYLVTGPDGVRRPFGLADYRADMEHFQKTGSYLNGLSDPKNWNTDRLLRWTKEAKRRGLQVKVMSFQNPEWLGVKVAGTDAWGNPISSVNTAPQDWAVFGDIMGKLYRIVRPYADAYEFLNEPHGYIHPGDARRPNGKGYEGSKNLYAADYMYQAIDAMYRSERQLTGAERPKMRLGGGADDQWNSSYGVLGTLFSPEFAAESKRVDFVSIHKYGWRPANPDDATAANNDAPGNLRNLKRWLRQSTGRELPVYLNEWNLSPGNPNPAVDQVGGPGSVPFQARTFIDLMRDQAQGAAYYTFYPGDVPMDDYEASKGWVETGHGAYLWNNGWPSLRPFSQLWQLMSRELGLGGGESRMHSRSTPGDMEAVTFTNADSRPGAMVLNWNNRSRSLALQLNNLAYADGPATVKVWVSDGTGQKLAAPKQVTVTVRDGRASVPVELPPNSVAGVLVDRQVGKFTATSYEFESYANRFGGQSKIIEAPAASNGRAVTMLTQSAGSSEPAVRIPVQVQKTGSYQVKVGYRSAAPATLTLNCAGRRWRASVPASGSAYAETTLGVTGECRLPAGRSSLSLTSDNDTLAADSLALVEVPTKQSTGNQDRNRNQDQNQQ